MSATEHHAPSGELWVMRHVETDWAAAGRHTGRNDLPLNANGERQALELRDRLAGMPFDLVVSSPLQRARRTCELAGYGDGAEIDPDAVEWDYGAYEGRTTTEIRVERPGWLIWKGGVIDGETVADVGARADQVLARVTPIVDGGGRVAVFAHGHFLRILAARWIGQPPGFGEHLLLEPARISVHGFEREARVVTRWNS